MWNIRSIKFIAVVVGMLGSTLKKIDELHRRNCYKHSITAENSSTKESSYFKEGFQLHIRFAEMGVGIGEEKGSKN